MAVRAGRHSDFHRLVIELRNKARYSIISSGTTLEVRVTGIDSLNFSGAYAGTDFFRVKKVTTSRKGKVPVTTFLLNLKNNAARIRYRSIRNPERIIVDLYPGKERSQEAKKSHALMQKKVPSASASRRGYIRQKEGRFAFNRGWRWIYRKMAVKIMKDSYYVNFPDPWLDKLGEYLPMESGLDLKPGMDAESYLKTLTLRGETPRARTLQHIILLIRKKVAIADVELDLISTPENEFTPLAHFLIASAYEREGLYPESIAYYGMAYETKSAKKLKAMAALGKGRVLFVSGKVGESEKWFKKARGEGSVEAVGWHANSLLLKEDFNAAWSKYANLDNIRDPIVLMGFGDIKMIRGDYEGASLIFKGLESRFRDKAFLQSFFALREADSLLVLGAKEEALKTYNNLKKTGAGEGLYMAGLALADYFSYEGNNLLKARDLYREVAMGRRAASAEALLRLAEVLEKLAQYGEAMKVLDELFIEYPRATGIDKARFLRSKVAYKWIADLYASKKWHDVAIVNYRHGNWISFGKRAENFLRVGEALLRVGLTPDAVMALGKAEKIGRVDIRRKASFLLISLYLEQRDFSSAERLLEDMRSDSPAVESSSLWKDYYMEAQYLKGNYREVIRLGKNRKEGNFLLMRAKAYKELGMWQEALRLYSLAMKKYEKKDDKTGLIEARTGYADSLFLSGGFAGAIAAYEEAASAAEKVSGPHDMWARYRLSLSYARTGRDEEALTIVKELKKRDNLYGQWAEAMTMAESRGQ
ncbi:MAG: tetratricopeptide repeat protein [Thermodesulfobacteriota bacterium]